MRELYPTSVSAPDTPVVGVVTVCVDPETVHRIASEVNHMAWAPVHENLSKYPGGNNRAHWSARLKTATACIAVVDFDEDLRTALRTVDFLHQALPGKVSVIALSRQNDPATVLEAMRSGCSEYLTKPLDLAQFGEALVRLERRFTTGGEKVTAHGHILTFLGAKGGVGTTTLAVHMAIHLVRNHQKKTLLIDNHSEPGHVCLYLGIEGAHYSFQELLRSVNRLDTDLLQGFVVSHVSGLDVIASADLHGTGRDADPEAIHRTLEFLREEYDYVLLDCSTSLEEANMTVVEQSDQVFLVATPDIGAIRDLSRLVDGLLRFQQPTEKLRVVLNRSGSKGAMTTEQIVKAVRLTPSFSIPNSFAELAKAANMGAPVSPEDRSEFSTQLRNWTREIAGTASTPAAAAPPPKKGLAFWKSSVSKS